MNKYTSEELDKALAMLNENGNLTPIEYVSEDEKAHLDGIFRHLKALGLVELKEAGYIYGVLLLNKGLGFINEGGFRKREKKDNDNEKFKQLQEENLKLSNINLKLSSEKIEYEKKFRFWKKTSIILSIVLSLVGLFEFIRVILNLLV